MEKQEVMEMKVEKSFWNAIIRGSIEPIYFILLFPESNFARFFLILLEKVGML